MGITASHLGKISKSAIILAIGKVLVLIISIINSMLLSRFLSLNEYGTFSQINTVVSIVATVFVLGLPNSVNYFLGKADSDEERDIYLCTYYKLMSIMTGLCGIILVIFSSYISAYFDNESIKSYWFCLLVMPWTTITIESVSNVLVASKRNKTLVLFNFVRSLFLLSTVLIVMFVKADFFLYMIIYVVIDSFFSATVYFLAFSLLKKYRFGMSLKMIKTILAFSIPIGISSIIGTLNIKLDHLVVGYLFSTEDLAIFSKAATELPFTVLASSFTAVLLPQLVRLFKIGNNVEALSIWHKVIVVNAIVLFFCTTICLLFAPYIIKILYSDKYIPGTDIFKVYSLILVFRITYFGMILNAKGKPIFILVSSTSSLLLNLVLNILLVKQLGMIGAAISTLISVSFIQLLQLFISSKVLKVKFSQIFPWLELFKIFVVCLFIFVLTKGVLRLADLDYSMTSTGIAILIGSIISVIYLIICWKPIKSILKSI